MSKDSSNKLQSETKIRDVDAFMKNIPKGSHGCLFYTERQQKIHFLLNFLRHGLRQNELCIFATGTERIGSIEEEMKIRRLSRKPLDSVSILEGKQLYGSEENPDLKKWISSFDSVLKQSTAKGKKSVRIAADLSSTFIKQNLSDQWFELECAIERSFPGKIKILCAYDVNLFSTRRVANILEFYKQVLRSSDRFVELHRFAIFPFTSEKLLIVTLE